MCSHGMEKPCTIVLHDDRISTVDVLAGTRIMHVGEVAWLSAQGARTLCVCPAGQTASTSEISVHVSLASKFGFENRTSGKIELIDDTDAATAAHVEIYFRDQYLSRADMWQLMKCLEETVMYEGQVLKYLGSTIADVEQIWISGQRVESAYVTHPYTKPIFRSRSARYSILIEVSREMLECWSHGELMYERLIDDFLHELFQRWERDKARHLASVILFGRAAGADGIAKRDSSNNKLHGEDFYILLVSEVTSITWGDILNKIRRAFNDLTLSRSVCLAAESNILEAIHLTAMDFADDQNDAHLMSTGTSIIAVTAGTGLFDADHTLLKQTTDLLVGNSIGVDIVALSPKPLHPVPLFRYEHDGTTEYALPHWVDISFWRTSQDEQSSSWTLPDTEEPVHDIALPYLKDSDFGDIDTGVMDYHDNQVFGEEPPRSLSLVRVNSLDPSMGSVDTVRGFPRQDKPKFQSKASPEKSRPIDIPGPDSNGAFNKIAPFTSRRTRLPPHPLMQTGRKISLGPKGLAPSRGIASTTLSVEHAEKEKDINYAASLAPITSSDKSSGLAKAFQASLRRKPSQQSMVSSQFSDPDPSHVSRPIEIPAEPHQHTPNKGRSQESDELVKILEQNMEDTTVTKAMNDSSLGTTPRGKSSLGRRSRHDSTHEALDMLSPWVMLLNPCNPRRDNMRVASQYRKWQHVFPRAVSTGSFKWSSMCSPAALPLTSEYKPSPAELEFYYRKQVKRHVISDSTGLKEESASILVERLIDVRLIRGFQIVAIRNSGGEQTVQSKGRPILLSLGRRYHEIQRISDFEVQIVQYEPKAGIGSEETESQHYVTSYEPKMRTILGLNIKPEISYHSEAPLTDWTELDEHILRLAPLPDLNVTFKVRLVLLPVDIPRGDYLGGLSDQERRIEGIQRLTQLWQRQRYFSIKDQSHHVSVKKAASTPYTAVRDPNPLAIEYQTRDPSVVVNAHGPALSSQLEEGELDASLFPESEKHHSSNFDIYKLVRQMQELPPYGVEVRDRRWLTVTHLNCFRGDEMTTWLLGVFKDLELREDAVNVGNELMSRGVFAHVRQKHKFRDGHYFYQISADWRTTEYPDTKGLFGKGPWRSVPPTPLTESMKSPMLRPLSGISTTDSSSSSDRGTPGLHPTEPKQIYLSQSMQFNVDPQKKSNHMQIIELHYDRIHNPENCYHIQLEWLGTSAKLIREAITRWSSSVEGYGLKLMQLPLQEACKFREHHPYDQPQPVRLAVRPPDKILATPLMEPHTFSPRMIEDPMAYHKRLLKKLDFVLDYEAASTFTTSLDVRYSFGAPSYQHTQFLHKSGLVLAQVLADDTADFLLLPNRLATSKLASTTRPITEHDRPTITVDTVQKHFKSFCKNEEALRSFYREVDRVRPLVAPSPLSNASLADSDIPPMQLPPLSNNHRMQLRGL